MREPKSYTRSILKQVLPKYCSGLVVDIGAGRCKYKSLITQYAQGYIAIDNLASEYQYKQGEGLRIDVIGDVLKLAFKDEAFDTVICTEVIEHVPAPFVLMSELSRITRKGGNVLLSTGWVAPYHQEPKDYYRFSKDAFRYLCHRHGLEMIELIPKGKAFTLMLYFPLRMLELRSPLFLRVRNKLWRLIRVAELACEWLDSKICLDDDSIGYLAVGRKK